MGSGYFCAFLEAIICGAAIGCWLMSGFSYFLFLGGAALGAGAVMVALEFEDRRQAKKNMLERVDA
jgi:predicted MFS family arabinose efflux permease